MESSSGSKNPHLYGLLGGIAAAVLLPVLFSVVGWFSANDPFFLVLKIFMLGTCSAVLALNLFAFIRYRKGDPTAVRFDAGVIATAVLILFVLLTVSGVLGRRSVTMEQLEGRYQITELKGSAASNPYLALAKLSGIQLRIDAEGNAAFGYGDNTAPQYRFHPDRMVFLVLENGEETDQGGRFAWFSGKLILNGQIYLKKIRTDADP